MKTTIRCIWCATETTYPINSATQMSSTPSTRALRMCDPTVRLAAPPPCNGHHCTSPNAATTRATGEPGVIGWVENAHSLPHHAQRTRPLARGASRRTVGVWCGARHGPLKGHAGGHERHADVRRRTGAACLARPCGDHAPTPAPGRGWRRLCGLGGGTRAAPTRVASGTSSRCAGAPLGTSRRA